MEMITDNESLYSNEIPEYSNHRLKEMDKVKKNDFLWINYTLNHENIQDKENCELIFKVICVSCSKQSHYTYPNNCTTIRYNNIQTCVYSSMVIQTTTRNKGTYSISEIKMNFTMDFVCNSNDIYYNLRSVLRYFYRPGSFVGIANGYGLDSPGIKSR
jgi:archaellum component FlaF (FlaF/FlaG flagellin family)